MSDTTSSSDSLTFNDIMRAVEQLKANGATTEPTLIAPSLAIAKEWVKMYPGYTIWVDGVKYV